MALSRPWPLRIATATLSVATGIVLTSATSIRWWHPYCDRQDDGPGYFATGFPLPYSEFSGASSMTFVTNWIAYAANVAIFALLIWPVARWLARRMPPAMSIAVSGVFAVPAVLMLYMVWDGTIQSAWNIDGGDRYFQFRPYVMMQGAGHSACYA